MRTVPSSSVALFALLAATTAAAQPSPSTALPLKRVRLYETGVGYFERAGRIDSQKGVSLPVPAGHLDDALKTLVVMSADGQTSVRGIEFGSSASRSLALALAGLPDQVDTPLTHAGLLSSLKGAPVELRTAGGTHRGRLIDVLAPGAKMPEECASLSQIARREPSAAAPRGLDTWLARCAAARTATLLLLTERSEIRRFNGDDVTSVRPTDPAFRSRLSTALDALSQRGSQTQRKLQLQAQGGKQVTLGYVAEAPIWRSTYRLVLTNESDRAMLQGWALLHNDTDEDWSQIRMELVNGQPDSFLYPLAAPRYARRKLVTPERELSTVPQLLDRTVDNMWHGDSIGESFGVGGLGLSGVGEGGGGRGSGLGLGRLGSAGAAIGQSGVLSVGDLANVAEADGVESGALFRYALPSPVDLRAHGSALLPFLHRQVKVRRIAVFAAADDTARSAVHLENDTSQTLPPGTMAIFESGGFAGESALTRTKPAESRIVGFGVDLDVELTRQGAITTQHPRVLAFAGKSLVEHFVRHHHITHQLVNRSSAPRTVYLRLEFVRNSRITGVDETAFDGENDVAYGVFKAAPKERQSREVHVHEGLQRKHPLDSLTPKKLERLAAADTLPTEQRKLLRKAAALLRDAAKQRAAAKKVGRDFERVVGEMNRLRGHLGAISNGAADGADEFVQRLLAADDRAEALTTKKSRHETQATAKRRQAHRTLRKLKPSAKSG